MMSAAKGSGGRRSRPGVAEPRPAWQEAPVGNSVPWIACDGGFAAGGEEPWKELSRRRSILHLLRAIGSMAREEGYAASASRIHQAADEVERILFG